MLRAMRPYDLRTITNPVGTISISVIVRMEGGSIPPITLALIGATRSAESDKISPECGEGGVCTDVSVKVVGNLGVGVYADINGDILSCDFSYTDCNKVIALSASAESTVNANLYVQVLSHEGEKCQKESCFSYNIGSGEYKAEVKFDVNIGGVYKFQYKTNLVVALWSGNAGGDCK